MLDRVDLIGRRAIVTGGSRGIGFEFTKALLEAGARVVFNSRDGARNSEAVAALKTLGLTDVHAIACDVTADDAPERLLSFAEETVGGIDILVNNAGVATHHESFTAPHEIWDRTGRGAWWVSRGAPGVTRPLSRAPWRTGST